MSVATHFWTLCAALVCCAALPAQSVRVSATTLTGNAAQVGEPVTLEAIHDGVSTDRLLYRFRIRHPDEAKFRTGRDFSPKNTFTWVPTETEGAYEIELTARPPGSKNEQASTITLDVSSRTVGDNPVITPTAVELVFLYSAPPCPAGSRFSVTFFAPGVVEGSTPAMDCRNGRSMNVYLAGLRAGMEYTARHTVTAPDGAAQRGPPLSFTTGALNFVSAPTLPTRTPSMVLSDGCTAARSRERGEPSRRSRRADQCASRDQSVLFQNRLWEYSVATDTDGSVVWYLPRVLPYLTRPQAGGRFFALSEDAFGSDADQLLQEIDLAGNILWETSATAINEQLEARGLQRINSFHHEARRLPDGRILVLASNERLLQNPAEAGEIDVLGDAILVLNQDLQIDWFWNAFDHLDISRAALQKETCVPGGGGCPVFHLAKTANDWLHGNSLSLTPDGHLVYSARHQDWIIKIDFANGNGSGQVIWRLGRDGDLQAISDLPQPWFSHQHDANFVQVGEQNLLLLYDNSNARALQDATARSRGQLFEIDENARTARLVFNVDLGIYAFALGSAQRLENGNYLFLSGIDAARQAVVEEFSPEGAIVNRYDIATPVYRVHRMQSMYSP